jgi:uncharacterized protein (TIRG00374 family)
MEGMAHIPSALRRQALQTAAGHGGVLLLFFFGLAHLGATRGIVAGGLVASVVLGWVHALLWRHLPQNRSSSATQPRSRLGAANRITLLRGLLISLTAGFLVIGPRDGPSTLLAWLPGVLYLAAALLDGLDGAWARRTGTQTALGETLDVRYDALGVLVACAVAVASDRLPAYYLAAGGAYYLFQWGLWLRRRWGKPVYPAGPRTFARLVAGFQMGFLATALLPIFSAQVLAVAAPMFLLPLLAGFTWDWLIVVGRIDTAAAHCWTTLPATLRAIGPLLLRGAVLLTGGMIILSPAAGALFGVKIFIGVLVLMVTVGFLGRSAALVMSLLLAWHASGAGLSPLAMTSLATSLLLMMTGTGAFSLWRPEDAVLRGAHGGPKRRRSFPWRRAADRPTIAPASEKSSSTRRVAGPILVLATIAGLLYWAFRDVALGAVVAAIGRWEWHQWGLFAAVNIFILAAMCWRWAFILRRMGHPVAFSALIVYRMGANTLSYITPGPQFGGEPYQVHCLVARHRMPSAGATASVAVDRLVELMGNLLFLSLAGLLILPALLTETEAILPVTAAMLGVVLAIGLLLYGVAAHGRPFSRMAAKTMAWFGRSRRVEGLIAFLEAGEGQAAAILTNRLWGWYGLGGLLQWSGFLAELWVIYAFMGMPLSVTGLLTLAVAARAAFLLPLPGGLGALEASQVLAITSLGGDPAVAAAACGIMRARDLVLISIGGILAWRGIGPHKERGTRPPLEAA